MTRPRQVADRVAALDEIGEIMGAMKNLALMELHKLHGLSDARHQALRSIEAAGADLSAFWLRDAPRGPYLDVALLVGAERGFCGDLNETLIASVLPRREPGTRILAVGSRLATRLTDAQGSVIAVAGASVVEEVEGVLAELVAALDALQREAGEDRLVRVTAHYHDDELRTVRARRLTPVPEFPDPTPGFPYPPLLTMAPLDLFQKLMDQYLYAMLSDVLYGALLAENQRRLVHMENALHHVEEDRAKLQLKYNALRQEEITEEIEVILLSAEAISASA